MTTSIWQFREENTKNSGAFSKEVLDAAGGSPVLARLLANRGLTRPEDISAFLNLQDYQPTSGWELPDAKPAVERILKAIENDESILVYGDFDVDGITGTSVLYETLKKHLKAKVSFYIPDRATEGHGLNLPALICLTSSRNVKLVITTDTGITNFSEVSLLKGLGVDTIVTDHHALPENLPPALANVNPQRLLADNPEHPLGPMCGAGVAYKLCELLLDAKLPEPEAAIAKEALLDIVAVGTVVDMVPLTRENRSRVYRGLQVRNKKQRPGFNEILAQAGFKEDGTITSETLGFTIGPRLNALGRLERADQGVELLTTPYPETARTIAQHLEYLNAKRRELCDKTFLEAESHLRATGGLEDKRAVILGSPDWNPGIIGIVASRLIEKYHVPVFMMVVDEAKGVVRCSGRSIPGFNLHDELLALEDYFLNFGGHAGAGGFSLKLERLEAFKRELHAICIKKIADEQMRPVVEVDAKLEWSQVNPHLIELVRKLAPFGMENPSPKFVIEDVNVAAQRFMGEGDRHLKLVLTSGKAKRGSDNNPLEGIIWNFGKKERFDSRMLYHFAVVPELNTFNGVTKVQLLIEDYKSPEAAKTATETVIQTSVSTVANQVSGPNGSPSPEKPPEKPEAGPQWIDHRNRDSLETFVGQLIQPLQAERRVLVYHEGRKPELPFLDERLLCGRLQVKPADDLVLWDLPPSAKQFQQLLDWVKPEVVHLIGGKYQSMPLNPSEQNCLKLILQVLRRGEETQVIDLKTFASQLATTTAVVAHGLILLGKLSLLETRLVEPGMLEKVEVRLLSQNGSTENLHHCLEFVTFQQALKEVGKYRGWLLNAPLGTIRAALGSSSSGLTADASVLASPSENPSVPEAQVVLN